VLEATSVYPVGLTVALAAAGFPAAVMNPEQPHAFLRSEGQRTNTDRTDARLFARVGQQKQPTPSPVLTEPTRDLKELVACREDVTKLLPMEKNRRQVATDRTRAHHQAIIDHRRAERRAVATEIAALIAVDPALTSRQRIRQSVPGIGAVLAPVLLAGLTELGHGEAKARSCLSTLDCHHGYYLPSWSVLTWSVCCRISKYTCRLFQFYPTIQSRRSVGGSTTSVGRTREGTR